MKSATIVATIDQPISAATLSVLPPEVGCIEVRADLAGDIDAHWLRQHFSGQLLYSLRRAGEGGASILASCDRRERILRALRDYDCVQLDTGDLATPLRDEVPPARRVISWHGPAATRTELGTRLQHLSSFGARFYRIAQRAVSSGDELEPLALLHSARRSDVVAYAEGVTAMWTRVVALQLGAPAVFGSVVDDVEAGGVPPVGQLITDYGLPAVDEAVELFGIAGNPVYRSLSPRLHNAAFRTLRRAALYLPFHVTEFGDFWKTIIAGGMLDRLGLPMRAICVVSPHKEIALDVAKSKTYFVQKAASTNFIVRDGAGLWTADTTDPEGVLLTLRERGVELAAKKVAVVGCGGSGRAVASALSEAGAEVTLVNRSAGRGALAVRLLQLPFVPLSDFSSDDYSIVVNATPVGRDGESLPFVVDPSRKDAVVVDLVYGSTPTPLVASARMAGQIAVDGVDVLLAQVRSQFRLMTGEEMPENVTHSVARTQRRHADAALTR